MNNPIKNYNPLQQSQQVLNQEQKLISKAKTLKNQLQSAKQKKQAQAQKKLRELTVTHYQECFKEFTEQFYEYAHTQIASLELIKQLKMNEIVEFEKMIEEGLGLLEKTLVELNEHEKEITMQKQTALQFLKNEEKNEIRKVEEEIHLNKEMKIKEYQKSIDIS